VFIVRQPIAPFVLRINNPAMEENKMTADGLNNRASFDELRHTVYQRNAHSNREKLWNFLGITALVILLLT
jgi:hypothetical protein